MPTQRALLHSPVVHNVATAAAAGLLTLAHPARFPRWTRRGLRLVRVAGTVSSVYLVRQQATSSDPHAADTPSDTAAIVSAVAEATSSIGLLTSGIGIAVDRKVETFLVRRGLRHPRVWMAVGVAGAVIAFRVAQDFAAKHTDFEALAERQKQALSRATGHGASQGSQADSAPQGAAAHTSGSTTAGGSTSPAPTRDAGGSAEHTPSDEGSDQ